MPDHELVQTRTVDDGCIAVCSCGSTFHASFRPEAEAEQRRHAQLEGIAEARAALTKREGDA